MVRQSLVSLPLYDLLTRHQLSQREGEVSVIHGGGDRAAVTTMLDQKLIPTGDDEFGHRETAQDCPYLPPNLPSPRSCSRLI